MNKTIVTVTGPTCSGKSTLVEKLIKETQMFVEIVSTTTRPQRSHEVDGVHYNFVTQEEFDQIEMLERITFNNNTYGASVQEFEEKFASGLQPIIVVEPNGMFQINRNAAEKGWRVINIFVNCPVNIQAERFLRRFATDASADGVLLDDIIKEYTGRLSNIVGVERGWIRLFQDGKSHESLTVPVFDRDNEGEVMITIFKMLWS